MTATDGEVRITGVEAGVENAAILARFTLGGRPVDPQWQGAFGRALEGRLDTIAGRWRVDPRGIAVTRVEPDHAARVAEIVGEAVEAANVYVAGILDVDRADRDAAKRHATALRCDVAAAQTAMRAQLRIPAQASSGGDATPNGDDERWFRLGVVGADGAADLSGIHHEPQADLAEALEMAESLARTSRRTIGVYVEREEDSPLEVGRRVAGTGA